MGGYEKILTLENEVEARLMQQLLDERGIPHLKKSYYDSALNGLYQAQKGWGHIEAPDAYREEILEIFHDLSSRNAQ